MYENVVTRPSTIPSIAPSLLISLKNIPINSAGNMVEAARPNAKATT